MSYINMCCTDVSIHLICVSATGSIAEIKLLTLVEMTSTPCFSKLCSSDSENRRRDVLEVRLAFCQRHSAPEESLEKVSGTGPVVRPSSASPLGEYLE